MRIIFAAAIASLAAAVPAHAQNFDGDRVLQTFERADFLATLAEIGAQATPVEGQTNLRIEFPNGLKADGVLMACDDNANEIDCYGTSILASFSAPSDSNPEAIIEAINTYNYRQNFGRAFIDGEGGIKVRMYVISDGGITMENYRRQIVLWTNSAEEFFGYLYGND